MPDATDDRRRFTEQEIGVILQRAAELQQHEPGGMSLDASSLSLAELEQVAHEAGIDPVFVRRAAGEVGRPAALGRAAPLLGAPLVLEFEREVDGEVGPGAYELLVEEIRGALHDVGAVNTLGRSLAWRSTSVQRLVSVTVTPRAGCTRIRIEERLANLAGGLFGGIGGGLGGGGLGVALGVGIGALNLVGVAIAAAAAFVVGSYALARGLYRGVAQRRGAELARLADTLADRAAESLGRGGSV